MLFRFDGVRKLMKVICGKIFMVNNKWCVNQACEYIEWNILNVHFWKWLINNEYGYDCGTTTAYHIIIYVIILRFFFSLLVHKTIIQSFNHLLRIGYIRQTM